MSTLLSNDSVAPTTTAKRQSRHRARALGLGLCLVGLLAIVLWQAPVLLWAYNVEQAGRLMANGLEWPRPRQVDSLPSEGESAALEAALGHLSAAIHWRPEHPHAYRLAGQIYAAQQDWPKAREAFGHARLLDPDNPLGAWEAALATEQMRMVARDETRGDLLAALQSAAVEAPDQPIETPFCGNGQPQNCYIGRTSFSLPHASDPQGPPLAADVVFLHPPARARLNHTVDGEHTQLLFLIGLDPQAHNWGSDGATFHIWVENPAEEPTAIYQATIDGAAARQGWVEGSADLSPWAGKEITLAFGVDGGPAGNTIADWYGWGRLTLTTRQGAEYATMASEALLRADWRAAGLDLEQLIERGEEARSRKRLREAVKWYERAASYDPGAGAPWYHIGLVYQTNQELDNALDAFKQAVERSPQDRDSWSELALIYEKQQEWDLAAEALRQGAQGTTGSATPSDLWYRLGLILQLSRTPPDVDGALAAYEQALANGSFTNKGHQADAHQQRGNLLATREQWQAAVDEYGQAAALAPNVARYNVPYAFALWRLGARDEAYARVQRAIDLNPKLAGAHSMLGDFYAEEGRKDEARAMYEKALELDPGNARAREGLAQLEA